MFIIQPFRDVQLSVVPGVSKDSSALKFKAQDTMVLQNDDNPHPTTSHHTRHLNNPADGTSDVHNSLTLIPKLSWK